MQFAPLNLFVEIFGIDDKARAADVRSALDRIGQPQPERLIMLDDVLGTEPPYRGANTRAIVKCKTLAGAAALRAACKAGTRPGQIEGLETSMREKTEELYSGDGEREGSRRAGAKRSRPDSDMALSLFGLPLM